MKKLILLLALFINTGLTFATEQMPDILYFKGEKMALATGWGHPSPLQTYFYQNNIEYPFEGYSTANYRGHIAVWEIVDSMLFLNEVHIDEKKHKPAKFKIKSKSDSINVKNKVFADWFCGVVIGEERNEDDYWKVEKYHYFYIKYGKIVKYQIITNEDFKLVQNITEKDTANEVLMKKYSMLYLNNSYISYYFRINGKDTITIGDKGGYLQGKSGMSPLLIYYSNDHMEWPYNWENYEKNGAPFCTWNIENDSLLLSKLELHTGTGFYSIDKYSVELIDLFPQHTHDNKVFGDWISGIFIISHGYNEVTKSTPDYSDFKTTEYTLIRLKEGILIEKYTVPVDFNFDKVPSDSDEGLKILIKEFNK